MATLPENPCRERHPEFALWINATTLGDVLPRFACPRCSVVLGIEEAVRLDERAKVAEEAEVEWASFLAHGNSAGRGYAYVEGHASREDAQSMADYLATPERPAWVGWRMVHPFQHDHPDPENAAAIARQHAANGPRIAVEAPAAHAESHRMGEGSDGAQEAVG